MTKDKTQFEKFTDAILNHKWIAIVCVVGFIVIGLASFTESLTKLWTFGKVVTSTSSDPPGETELDANVRENVEASSTRSDENDTRPDLIISSIEPPRWNRETKQTEVQVRVKNIGAGFSNESVLKLVDPGNEDTSKGSAIATILYLKPGDEMTATLTFPYWVLNPNSELQATIDPDDEIHESNEENNTARRRDVG